MFEGTTPIADTPADALVEDTLDENTPVDALTEETPDTDTDTPPVEPTPEEKLAKIEQERRDMQAAKDRAEHEANMYKDMLEKGILVPRDNAPAQTTQTTEPSEPQAKTIEDFMNPGEEFDKDEAGIVGSPSWQAVEDWRDWKTDVKTQQRLTKEKMQNEEAQRLQNYQTQLQGLQTDNHINASPQEITHFENVWLPNVQKNIGVKELFTIYRQQTQGIQTPPVQTVKPNSATPASTAPAQKPPTTNSRWDNLEKQYAGDPKALASIQSARRASQR